MRDHDPDRTALELAFLLLALAVAVQAIAARGISLPMVSGSSDIAAF